MTYAIGIVAHPARNEQAHQLAADVDADLIVVDTCSQGEQWCHQETLTELMKRDVDWYVLLEDDALPCQNFRALLEEALNEAGDALISLYLGTGAWAGTDQVTTARLVPRLIAQADRDSAHWITAPGLYHAVGIAIPAVRARAALAHMRAVRYASDKALSRWAHANHIPIRYTWPSLVDHADGERLAGEQRNTPRRAWRTHPME